MKFLKAMGFFVLVLVLFFALPSYAQMGGGHHGGGHHGGRNGDDHNNNGGRNDNHNGGWGNDGMCGGWRVNPDSLDIVDVQGIVIIDSTMGRRGKYFLDADGDGQADYRLNFGPYWYTPDSSNAQRPRAGETVSITGGSHDDEQFDIPVIIVYEINGEFWRDPYTPFWNNMGEGFHHGGRDRNHGWHGGMMNDSLAAVSLNGIVYVDSTLMPHYYLDEDGDGAVDYFLNFGPPWYEPESGAVRPRDGDEVSIVGGLHSENDMREMAVVIVYEINGLVWRDSTAFGHYAGGWIGRKMRQVRRINNPFDRDDWMEVHPGWYGGSHHGGGMMTPDSLWCQLNEIYPENLPGSHNQAVFAAFQIDMFTPNGQSIMRQNGRMGHVSFNNQARFQFHYSDEQVEGYGEDSLTAFVWDDQSNAWQPVADAVVDAESNTVTFTSEDVNSYVILSTAQITNIGGEAASVNNFVLKQNYPNPFNPTTTIEFSLLQESQVTLNVYNVIGQLAATLVEGSMSAGVHQVEFNAENLNSGVYFYELRVGRESVIRAMNLVK